MCILGGRLGRDGFKSRHPMILNMERLTVFTESFWQFSRPAMTDLNDRRIRRANSRLPGLGDGRSPQPFKVRPGTDHIYDLYQGLCKYSWFKQLDMANVFSSANHADDGENPSTTTQR